MATSKKKPIRPDELPDQKAFEEADLVPLQTNREVGRKDDADKPRFDLVPMRAHASMVDVLTYGLHKYTAWNWVFVKNPRHRYFRAAMGHLWAWWRGEKLDNEPGGSGLPHLAHALCCIYFLLEFDLTSEGEAIIPPTDDSGTL